MAQRQHLIVVFVFITVLALTLSPACKLAKEKVEAMKPEVREISLDWGKVTSETTEVIATITAYNPNPFSLPVKKAACGVSIAGVDLASAKTKGLKIKREAEFPIKVLAEIDNSKIPDFWASHLKNGERSQATIDLNTTFDLLVTDFTFPYQFKIPVKTDLLAQLGQLEPIPIEKRVKMPVTGEQRTVFKMTIESLSGEWGNITPNITELNLAANIHNKNPYPVSVPKVAYDIRINDIPLASGETGANYLFAPNSKSDITSKVELNTMLMDKWFVTHIRQNERSTFYVKTSLVFELPAEPAQALGIDKVAVDIWETDKEFETNLMPQSIKKF